MFERNSMEQILTRMLGWTRGVTGKLTDFRVGSKILTLYESVALVVESLEDRVFRSQRKLIEDNIYAVIGFDKLPATTANGWARFARSTPADQAYIIPAGTVVLSRASEFTAPQKYRTSEDALLQAGALYVDVQVFCTESGTIGNIDANTLTEFVAKPSGIETVSNPWAFTNGKEEETNDEQKERFQQFVEAQARGVLQSVAYGGKLCMVVDATTGLVIEKVVQAIALEDLPARRGEVDLYVWNGIGEASADLIAAIEATMTGYNDADGNPVYGYKPAGIQVNVYSAPMRYVSIQLEITPESWTTLELVKPKVESEIDRYFANLKLGQTLIQTALEANLKFVDGVFDVKMYLSLDNGQTFTSDNITTGQTEVLLPNKPILYA